MASLCFKNYYLKYNHYENVKVIAYLEMSNDLKLLAKCGNYSYNYPQRVGNNLEARKHWCPSYHQLSYLDLDNDGDSNLPISCFRRNYILSQGMFPHNTPPCHSRSSVPGIPGNPCQSQVGRQDK